MTDRNKLFDLAGKTALVTGASSGLGSRFSKTLADNGAKVILCARNKKKLELSASEISQHDNRTILLPLDISDKKATPQALDKLFSLGEKIDILVNNAGIYLPTPVFQNEEDNNFEDVLSTNLTGMWHLTKIVAQHMKKHNLHGSIINVSSINGANALREEMAGYAASKAAIIQMSKALVGELSPHKIRINCIAPGLFHTPLTDYKLNTPGMRKEMAEKVPLGYIPSPEEMDGTLLYLASNASRYVTGSTITVDGGASWGGPR